METGIHTAHVIDVDGGFDPRLMAEGGGGIWSPDGRWIYVSQLEKGIWRVPAAGGEAQRVMEKTVYVFFLSSDGRFIYYTKKFGPATIFRATTDGDREEIVLERDIGSTNWTLWGAKHLVYRLRPTGRCIRPAVRSGIGNYHGGRFSRQACWERRASRFTGWEMAFVREVRLQRGRRPLRRNELPLARRRASL